MEIKQKNLVKITIPLIVGIFINILGSVFNTLVPLAVRKFIDFDSQIIIGMNWLFPIFIFLLAQVLLTSIGTYIISCEGDKQLANVRIKIKKHMLGLPTSFFDNFSSGELSSRIINDVTILRVFLTVNIPQVVIGIITIFISGIVLFSLDWKLALFIFLIFPLDALITVPVGKINQKISIEVQTIISKLVGTTAENFKNIRTVKLNNAEEYVLTNFITEVKELYKLSLKTNKIFSITQPVQRLIAFILIISVILYGGFRVSQGSLTVGTLISFMIFLFQLIGPINNVADFYNSYKRTKGSTDEINYILSMPTEFIDDSNSKIKDISDIYKLSLKNVFFSYDDIEVLRNVNMTFETGNKIAIVGATGAGKSTIVNLITRLYSLEKNMLMLNEKDASEFKLNDWRNLFSVVSQENTIFTGSIIDNLVFGLNYLPTNKEIEESIEFAHLSDDIRQFPKGLHTIVGEQGIKLSGGQRQRLQIARTYLKKSEFIILDEATSNLDSQSERIISNNLNNFMNGKTIISIAHRLSTIVDADRIYFMENKTIKDVGTHFELLERVPTYKKFVEEQIIKTEIAN